MDEVDVDDEDDRSSDYYINDSSVAGMACARPEGHQIVSTEIKSSPDKV